MVLLFLLSLVLAWPTAGLSVVAFIVIAVAKSYLNARARMHAANMRSASRAVASGQGRVPSWAGDKGGSSIFIEAIQAMAMRKGVPRVFLWAILQDQSTFEPLVRYAGAMEDEGASFIEQQVAVAEKLVEIWRVAPAEVRKAALAGE